MIKPMHKELFDFYSLNNISEKNKRAIRKTINKYYKDIYGSKEWSMLTDTQKRDFRIITMKRYMIEKILYPDNDKKTNPTTRAKQKAEAIEKKIEAETRIMHKPLIFIEEHNKKMEILKRDFYDPSATKEENYKSYLELCENISNILPTIAPPSFEDWLENPQRIFDMRESHKWTVDYDSYNEEDPLVPVSKEEIMLIYLSIGYDTKSFGVFVG